MDTNRHTGHSTRHAPRVLVQPPVAPAADATLELPAPEEHELIEGPSREDLVRRRAYDLYQRNGCIDGHALDDWLAAEAELDREVLEGTSPIDGAIQRE